MPAIRRGEAGDLVDAAGILADSPSAAQWPVASYLDYEFLLATLDGAVAGFLVWRALGADEREILNLAVAPAARRRGVGRSLMKAMLRDFAGAVFLEVRESNTEAQTFYQQLGFERVSVREKYYLQPEEGAIVMKFHS
jgi:ribosomal-protein-alanine N-acetyltransferase